MRLWWRWLAGNPRNKMELIYSYIYMYIQLGNHRTLIFFFPLVHLFFDGAWTHLIVIMVTYVVPMSFFLLSNIWWFYGFWSHTPFCIRRNPQETLPFSGGLYISEMALAGPLLCNFRNLSELSLLMGERVDNICPLISNPFQKPWSM